MTSLSPRGVTMALPAEGESFLAFLKHGMTFA